SGGREPKPRAPGTTLAGFDLSEPSARCESRGHGRGVPFANRSETSSGRSPPDGPAHADLADSPGGGYSFLARGSGALGPRLATCRGLLPCVSLRSKQTAPTSPAPARGQSA